MWVTVKTICPVLLLVVAVRFPEASSTGWKPIPPPPGVYVAKTTFPVRSSPLELKDYGFEGHREDASPEDTRKHQKFDVFPPDDIVYPKDPLKPFKSVASIYDPGRKRPLISHSSFSPFPAKKPVIYVDKPGPLKDVLKYKPPKYLTEYKHHKGFTDNEVSPFHSFHSQHDERCPLYKVSFRQDLYFQYIQYKVHMPDLKEFTICMWSKFHNHSYDHPLFSYAVRHQPKAIYMWVSNTERSNYYNMKINGHPIFRLNYPIRLNKWFHTCQSWNSKSGEWQVWVNGQRIGRGFHNLLVGHVIPGGGIAISGQEQLQYGGGFLEASDFPKGSGGFLGELTMVQLYRIALSPGKAYTDHRHHHSHYTSTTPEPPEIPTEEPAPTPEHPFLENGQLKKPLKVFELAESLRTKGNLDTPQNQPSFTDFFDGHFVNPYLVHGAQSHFGNSLNHIPFGEHVLFKRHESGEVVPRTAEDTAEAVSSKFATSSAAQIKFAEDEDDGSGGDWSERVTTRRRRRRRRRSANETYAESEEERVGRGLMMMRPVKRPTRQHHGHTGRVVFPVRKKSGHVRHFTRKESVEESESSEPKKIAKKQVILGDVHFRPGLGHEFGYLHNGLPVLEPFRAEPEKVYEPVVNPLDASEEEEGPAQPEPAEDEVKRIMSVCSGCERDPYRKVAVISWRSTPKKLFSGALFLRARSECRKF